MRLAAVSSVILVLLIVCMATIKANAQNATGTTLSGTVTDAFGSALDGVRIELKGHGDVAFYAESSTEGEFKLEVPPGIYRVTFRRAPFRPFTIPEFQIARVRSLRFDLSLICADCQETDVRRGTVRN